LILAWIDQLLAGDHFLFLKENDLFFSKSESICAFLQETLVNQGLRGSR
jgi:hypothetical protein